QPAVGGDELGGEQVVDREPVLAYEVADAAAERQAPDPDRAGVAEPDRELTRLRGGRQLAGGQAGLRPCDLFVGIDLERLEARQVEHDPALAGAVAGRAVAPAPDGELEPLV